ncbi:phospholipase C, phosphocholine-specific [Burkholderia humptydooensis]|uniref:phospholipase C n=2 Tax=Burkholderia humptydooensis TaxID=430531 RepID=A0A7U4SSS0_9BURK|nr:MULTISPECIES: phospholipase C, phosphocholine-specific [Burkholderia]AJY42588.1 phospholipase C, phosphocholine-specific [Burkholderia sp. 2002721687]ALX43133.1 phospholipase C, phosphocholine-specific [Burkholderia humptydooensis]EIP84774.1 Phosphoesterase [Burkholderia humptydooensis MSMB43]QPS44956.1 phospholipase C, phosphocholine-specific [Burkholderia humptydooensis]
MQKKPTTRRQFLADALKLAGATAVTGVLPESILRAQSIPPATVTGTIQDVKHVVILMQENRAFDHYLGTLCGVRGFGDPRPVVISSGYPVWHQPWLQSSVLPFHPTPPAGMANGDTYYNDLDHSWETTHIAWNFGRYDNWVQAKTSGTMYYFTQSDIPFYYALASTFTVCDDYHCSMLGPTDPNRLYLFTGCCGNVPGSSPYTTNNMAGTSWATLPERLNASGITWKFYQDKGNGLDYVHGYGEYNLSRSNLWWNGNYGDNTILNFKQYQFLAQNDPLAPALNGTQIDPIGNGKEYDKDLFSQLQADVANDALPQVSWIVAPYAYCEHPSWAASGGEWYVSNVLNALTSNPKVWASTVLLVMYDENDGLFDHVPPAVPASSAAANGHSTVSTAAEFVGVGGHTSDGSATGDVPIGLGPRVPMFVISPWSKGGKVNSEVFDHTSVIRFLEARFGFRETNISPWRRTVCGDLTSAFDFSNADQTVPAIQPAASNMNPTGLPVPIPYPTSTAVPAQATGRSIACRLPYEFFVHGKVIRFGKMLSLTMANTGTAGVHLQVWGDGTSSIPRQYTIAAGESQCTTLWDALALNSSGGYDYSVYGPNGFAQTFRGNIGAAGNVGSTAEISLCYDVANGNVQITLDNSAGLSATTFQLTDNAYGMNRPQSFTVAAGATQAVTWYGDGGWYDASIRDANDPNFLRRVAGCVQALAGALLTDSAIGNTSRKFVAALAAQGSTFSTLRFDYVAPPWSHSPKNWVGIYAPGAQPTKANYLSWAYLPKSTGSLLFSSTANCKLASGRYDAWFFFDDGYTPLAGPITIDV